MYKGEGLFFFLIFNILIMGITLTKESNSIKLNNEGKLSSTDSPFISTETYNFIQNNDLVDTPVSEVTSDFNTSAHSEGIVVSDIENNINNDSFNVDDFNQKGSGEDLFVKSNEITNPTTLVSLEGLTVASQVNQNGGGNDVVELISIEGFTPSDVDTYDVVQKGAGNLKTEDLDVFDKTPGLASEKSFDVKERMMDFDDIKHELSEDELDVFSVSSRASRKPSRKPSRRSSRKSSRRSSRKPSRRSSRKSSRRSSRKSSRRSSRKSSRKKQRGGLSESPQYNFSATSEELLSSPMIGGAYSDGSSSRKSNSDSDNFRINGTRQIN